MIFQYGKPWVSYHKLSMLESDMIARKQSAIFDVVAPRRWQEGRRGYLLIPQWSNFFSGVNSRVGDLSPPEDERLQVGQPFELNRSRVGDLRATWVLTTEART